MIGAVGGLISGLILMLTGIMLSLISFVEHQSFHGAEIIILCSGFGSLILGTHCLDRIELEKANRAKEFKEARGNPKSF